MRAQSGICRNRDVIINGDVVDIDVVNPDTVSGLPNRGILLQFADLSLPVAGEPLVAHENFSTDGHTSCRTSVHLDIAGVSQDLEVNRAASSDGSPGL